MNPTVVLLKPMNFHLVEKYSRYSIEEIKTMYWEANRKNEVVFIKLKVESNGRG